MKIQTIAKGSLILIVLRGLIKCVNLITLSRFSGIIDWLNFFIILTLIFLAIFGFSKKSKLMPQFHLVILSFFAILLLYPFQLGQLFKSGLFLPTLIHHVNAKFWWENLPINTAILLVLELGLLALSGLSLYGKQFIFKFSRIGTLLSLFLIFPAIGMSGLYFLIQKSSSDFLTFMIPSLEFKSVEKIYSLNGKKIHLIPMMHVAKKGFYSSILKSLPSKGLVITEGVKDERKLLKSKSGYGQIAKLLGLENQKDLFNLSEYPNIDNINGDIDVKVFTQTTIDFLNWVFQFYENIKSAAGIISLDLKNTQLDDTIIMQVFNDILTLRDHSLWASIQNHLEKYEEIIVPWGALHLPFIEKKLLELGFKYDTSISRTLIKLAP